MNSSNWAGNYQYRARQVHVPHTLEEVQDLVAAAHRIKAVGSRHSFNDIADSPGDQLNLAALPAELDIDRARNTVTVSGGIRYGDFIEQLHGEGFAIHNLASLPHISVAGAVATATHGSGVGNGNLASAVAGLELVTGTGEVLRVTRGSDNFAGMVVALGALGIVTRVTLDIQPSFQVRQDVYDTLSWADVTDNFDAITSAAYSVSLFTSWGTEGVSQVWLKSRTDADATFPPVFFGGDYAREARHPLPGVSPVSTTEQVGAPGPWWNRLAHFKLDFTPSHGDEVQTEYLLPRDNALAAIDALRALGPHIAPHLFIAELRTVAADELWLSTAYHQHSVGFHFTWKKHAEALAALLPDIDAALAPLGGRPHWGKVFITDPDRFEALYPQLPAFRQLAETLDPEHKFRNDYLDRTVFAEARRPTSLAN
ncbi:FAD-binding protein [Parafrigoribacterium mesophilum]|uniref:D-arabinono-1,4-lactone oxidase n=1 Tax=Parafrigoribacterium mesophilum TaxID=433646 RepID=UPI0031FE2D4C